MGKEQQLCSGSNLRCLKPALISLGLTTAPLQWGDFLQVGGPTKGLHPRVLKLKGALASPGGLPKPQTARSHLRGSASVSPGEGPN